MKLVGKTVRLGTIAATFMVLATASAHAASFAINFCPGGAGCPANVSQASLTFTEDLGTADANDYTLDLKIVGGAGNPTYIDQVSFTINAADNVTGAGGYEVKPTLLAAPGGTANWTVFYDNVNQGGGCSADTNNSKDVCAQSGAGLNGGKGAVLNGTNIWSFSVNLADDVAPLSSGSLVNLRAAFLNADGSNGGILSPNGGPLIQCSDPSCGNVVTAVPEPTSMALFGTGLILAARARNRRRNR